MFWTIAVYLIFMKIQTILTVVCLGGQADLIFILDSSCSVNINHPDNYDRFKEFMKNITTALDVGENSVRIGTIRFSLTPDIMFTLNDTFEKDEVLARIDDIAYECHATYTDLAIEMMRLTGFSEASGERNDVVNIGVVLTDGKSEDTNRTAYQSAEAQAEGIYMVSVGVTGADDSELSAIATDPDDDYKFYVEEFTDLASIEEAVAARCCAVASGRPTFCVTQACLDISGGLTDNSDNNGGSRPWSRLAFAVLLALSVCLSRLCIIV